MNMNNLNTYLIEDKNIDEIDIVDADTPENAARAYIDENYASDSDMFNDIVIFSTTLKYPKIDIKGAIDKYYSDNPDGVPNSESFNSRISKQATQALQDVVDKWMNDNASYYEPVKELYRFIPPKKEMKTKEELGKIYNSAPLLEPPAQEVVQDLVEDIFRLQDELEKAKNELEKIKKEREDQMCDTITL